MLLRSFLQKQATHLLLTLLMFLLPSYGYAQANYFSILGETGCSNNNRMRSFTPLATNTFKGIPGLNPFGIVSVTPSRDLVNSAYNNAGQLLFTVNNDGIFAPDGDRLFAFCKNDDNTNVIMEFECPELGGQSYTFEAISSEKLIIPTPGKQNSYYVIFWCKLEKGSDAVVTNVIRCVRVDINTGLFGTHAAYYFEDKVFGPPGYSTNCATRQVFVDNNQFLIAATPPNSDCSRDIYTVIPAGMGPASIRKWHIAADGTLPNTSTTITSSISRPYMQKCKIFNIGGDKVLAYVTGGLLGNSMVSCNLTNSSHDICTYEIPVLAGGSANSRQMWGFEYLPAETTFCFTFYESGSSLGTGFFGYSPVYTSGIQTIQNSGVTGINAYQASDLELTKNGDMLLADLGSSTSGSLAYIPASALTNSFTASVPSIINGTCTATPPVSINTKFYFSTVGYSWYLPPQIRGEDYNSWGGGSYTLTGNEVWSASNNPSGAHATTIYMSSIIIPAGKTLVIDGITVKMSPGSYIEIGAGASAAIAGGKLTLRNATLTRSTNACGGNWEGIFVKGNSALPQTNVGGTSTSQGWLDMLSSTISYAKAGVQAGWFLSNESGGIVTTNNSTFENDGAVSLCFYANFDAVTGSEINNRSRFVTTSFITNDISAVSASNFVQAGGWLVNGVLFRGCTFANNITSYPGLSYGIYGMDMGLKVESYSGLFSPVVHSSFKGFATGIYHQKSFRPDFTVNIQNATFNKNNTGISLRGTYMGVVAHNTFNVPVDPSSGPYSMGMTGIGLLLHGATEFSVYNNTFNRGAFFAGSVNNTVGIYAISTQQGSEENEINNNIFNNLGTACEAFGRNNATAGTESGSIVNHGLWYKCNFFNDNERDIAIMGNDIAVDGIRLHQGYPIGNHYGPHYSGGLPAGNYFSQSCTNYNLTNIGCASYAYYYTPQGAALIGHPREEPGVPSCSGISATANSDVSCQNKHASVVIGECEPGYTPVVDIAFNDVSVHVIRNVDELAPIDRRFAIRNNVNYYMTCDTLGQRDSLYYWVSKIESSVGDVITASMLVQDSLIDSAYAVYDAIPEKYGITGDMHEEHLRGRQLLDIQVRQRIHHHSNPYVLDSATLDSLHAIAAAGNLWTHVDAESWLYAIDSTDISDSLQYPPMPEEVPSSKGVLAITEISNGPAGSNCEYVEMIAGNCGDDQSPFVNIEGWIVDDNAGNFYTGVHDSTDTVVTMGHYRFAHSRIWQQVPVGSIIVLYNQDDNCYNLPGEVQITTTENGKVYWIPIGSGISHSLIERYETLPNLSQNYYCDLETGMEYATAAEWMNTIGLHDAGDVIQLRCPGCDSLTDSAAFYHAIGYGPGEEDIYYSMFPGGPDHLAGVIRTGVAEKYTFIGSNIAALSTVRGWEPSAADASGSVPSTLGNVPLELLMLVKHVAMTGTNGGGTGGDIIGIGIIPDVPVIGGPPQLASDYFPCCPSSEVPTMGKQSGGDKNGNSALINARKDIAVYPNPANMAIHFRFPQSAKTTIRLTDISGRIVKEQVVTNTIQADLEIRDHADGMYIYHVITDGTTRSGKVVIQK